MIKTAFAPVIDNNTQILILGSMPGEQSLLKQQYYANKHNAFWKIMFQIYNQNQFITNYSQKLALLTSHNIGLWDVFEACEREGSLDANIKNGVLNNFDSLLIKYPQIRLILFNGTAAYKAIKKQIATLQNIPYRVMPSTSPAHTMAYQLKLNAWRNALC